MERDAGRTQSIESKKEKMEEKSIKENINKLQQTTHENKQHVRSVRVPTNGKHSNVSYK
jgi:hypothetical protein